MPLFLEKLLRPPNKNEVEISVFGPGYGESIVLHIPEIGWGVVDSCITRIGNTYVVPALNYLLELLPPTFPRLAFVVLTHPHKDHYEGIEKVLRQYPGGTERVCRYDGDGIRELKLYLTQQRVAGNYVLRGLVDVFKAMEEAVKSGTQFRRLGEMALVFDLKNVSVEGYGKTDIRMMALSPSATSSQKYVEMLFKAFPQNGKPIFPINDEAHNLISVALLLDIGDIQVILGSDVENGLQANTGWNGIISNKDCPELWANLVKVSHHGSENGFNPLAWEQHCRKMRPLAIVTSFRQGKTILPKNEDIQNLKKVSHKVGLTSPLRLEKNLYKYYPRDVVSSLLNRARYVRIVEPTEKIGFIRTRFLLDGTITESRAEAPSCWY